MKRVLCSVLPSATKPTPLSEEESHHLRKVLRLELGAEVEALDGKGGHCVATLAAQNFGKNLALVFKKELPTSHLQNGPRTRLEVSILKNEAMHLVIEKAVELGFDELICLETDHTVVQTHKKGGDAFLERWQKTADQSLKQCGRLNRMQVVGPIKLKDYLAGNTAQRFWCREGDSNSFLRLNTALKNLTPSANLKEISFLVGPEGGWSTAEVTWLTQHPEVATPVTLGPLTLRAETAAILAMAWFRAFFWV